MQDDIKQTQPPTLASEAFRLLIDSVEDYAIFMLDSTGRVLTWNRGAERIKGYAASEIVGQHFSTFYLQEDVAAGKPATELRVAASAGRVEDEGWRVRKDGTRFWANVVITALHDDAGKLFGFGKVTRDLSERREAAETLRASEEQLRLLVEGVSDYAIYMLDPNGNVRTWNSGAQKIKGYARSEIVGSHYSRFFRREDVAKGRPEQELAIARRVGRFEEEGWRVRKDGACFWAGVVLTTVRDSDGALVGFAKVTRDLTTRKEAEETARNLLREQTARTVAQEVERTSREERGRYEALSRRLEVILGAIADGVTVQAPSGAVVYANSAAARLCGFDTVDEFLRAPAEEVTARFDILDETGEPFDMKSLPGRLVIDGAEHATAAMRVVERASGKAWWAVVRATPILGSSGEPELVVNVWHDVTVDRRREQHERHVAKAAAALASTLESEEMLQKLAMILVPGIADWCAIHLLKRGELLSVAVAHTDPAMTAQASDYTKRYPPQPTSERGVWNVVRTGQPELYPEISAELLERNAEDAEHLKRLRAVGMKSVILVPLQARGVVSGAISLVSAESGRHFDALDLALAVELGKSAGMALDNARLYEAERAAREQVEQAAKVAESAARAAEEASRVKDEFLATVSHELRTPLNAIVGWASLLQNGDLEPQLSKGLEVIHRNAQAQSKIIDDILDVSRIITGKLRLDLKGVDLVDVIKRAIDVVQPSASAKNLSIALESPPEHSTIVADPERLQQVIWNLLSNAVKFTDANGSIRVVVQREGRHISVTVTDTGRGIDPEFLPYVFDRFKQADSSMTRRVGGLGLGLALVRHILELHGGHVSVASPGLGHGSTFSVALPVRAVLPEVVSARAAQSGVATAEGRLGLAGLRVLIVDDEPDARDLLEILLEGVGATVETAASAADAFAALQRFGPDVLVSDIGMPDEDGLHLMRRVRALAPERGGGIPSIALSAYARAEDRSNALSAGFTTHIGKPVNPSDLLAAVANLARLASKRPSNPG